MTNQLITDFVNNLKKYVRIELAESNRVFGIADGFRDEDYKYLGVIDAAAERMRKTENLNNN